MYNQEEAYSYLLQELDEKNIKYSVHEFKASVKMVDIWYGELFYVVQIENDFAGISLIDDDNPGFSTTPDIKFFTINEFKTKLLEVFKVDAEFK